MKVANLVAHYLYASKSLTLQGIGQFQLDPSAPIPLESEKNQKSMLEGISFQSDPRAGEDTGLVDFIVKQTGKIRPLASADLDSFITLGRQMLNIGKPFFIDGIGTLNKNRDGSYEFSVGNVVTTKLEESQTDRNLKQREHETQQEEAYYERSSSPGQGMMKKLLYALAAVIVISGLGYGAYYLYTQFKSGNNASSEVAKTSNQETIAADSIKPAINTDSLNALKKDSLSNPALPAPPPGMQNWKFLINYGTDKTKILSRYNRLLEYKTLVKLETPDSVNFKLYIPIVAAAADTARKRDSIYKYYNSKSRIPVIIEQ